VMKAKHGGIVDIQFLTHNTVVITLQVNLKKKTFSNKVRYLL